MRNEQLNLRPAPVRIVLALLISCNVTAFDAGQQGRDVRAKAELIDAHQLMVKATEVTVSLLGKEGAESGQAGARSFPIEPYNTHHLVTSERVLRGAELKRLVDAWAELIEQDGYSQGLCHFPAHGLTFRSADGKILFQTSICWACHNYYVRSDGRYVWASLPKRFLPGSDFKKLVTGLFKPVK